MSKVKNLDGQDIKMLKSDEKTRIAKAYAYGSMNREMRFEFEFEYQAWQKGRADDVRIKDEIRKGDR